MSDPITLMDIPVDGEVHCKDGRSGTIRMVIINPITNKLTNVVVEYREKQHLVPRSVVAATTPNLIVLNCTRKELAAMEPFKEQHFISTALPDYDFTGEYFVEPFVYQEHETEIEEEELIPAGELAIQRTNDVCATDGNIGVVDEFVISRETGDISHIVLRKGFAWSKHEFVIPVSAIEKIDDDKVYLKLNKKQVADLPRVRINRWWN